MAKGQPDWLAHGGALNTTLLGQEWLNLRAYWKANTICHACHLTKNNYICVPNPLPHLPRRGLDDFLQNATHPGEKSTLDQHNGILTCTCST